MKFRHKLSSGYSEDQTFEDQKRNLAKKIFDMKMSGMTDRDIAEKTGVNERVVQRFILNDLNKYYRLDNSELDRKKNIALLESMLATVVPDAKKGDPKAYQLALKTIEAIETVKRSGIDKNLNVVHSGGLDSTIAVSGGVQVVQELGERAAEALEKFSMSSEAKTKVRNTHKPSNDISAWLPPKALDPPDDDEIVTAELVEEIVELQNSKEYKEVHGSDTELLEEAAIAIEES